MSIPKPPSLKFKSLQILHNAMVKTHPDLAMFQDFKYWIQFYASNMDPMKLKEQYSIEAWANFLDKVLIVQPELTFYESYWPVEAYFNTYMASRRRIFRQRFKPGQSPKNHRKRLKNAAMAPEISHNDELENVGPSSSEQSLNIRNTQQSMSSSPSRSRFPPRKTSNEHSVNRFGSRLDNIASRSVTLYARSQSPEWRSNNAIASSSSNPTVPVLHGHLESGHAVGLDASSRMSVQNMKETLVVTCCGHPTTVKSTFNKRLVDLVGNVDLLSHLAKLGIFLDQHLDELLHLKHDDLMIFFSDFASNQITPLAKLQLVKSLEVESFNIRKGKTLHSAFIPCPPLERRLSDPDRLDNSLFQKATKLEDDDFQKLMNAMETLSQDYLSIYRPNADQLCQVVTAISVDCGLLNKYENFWPLRIFLKRRSTSVRTCPLYSELEAEVVFSKVFKNQRHCELPTLVQLPCELHPFVDISRVPHTLKTRLHSLGIAGLIPALAYVGVHSDAHFADFCKLNDQERGDLFILGKLKLSQFQKFTLGLGLSSAN